MKTEPFNVELAIALTQEELVAKGADLSRALGEIERIDLEKKGAVAGFKERIEEKKKVMHQLTDCIRTGKELRLIECREQLNTSTKQVETFRIDNGDIVSVRPLTPDEQQLHMDVVMRGFEKDAKKHEEDAALVTTGTTVLSEMAQTKPIALAADNPTNEPDNDNAPKAKKKKGGAQRAREKKAEAEAAAKPKAKTKATKSKPKAEKPAKAVIKAAMPRAKKPKKPKPVLERHSFEDETAAE
jgi:membrane protein involved in colicin uptake